MFIFIGISLGSYIPTNDDLIELKTLDISYIDNNGIWYLYTKGKTMSDDMLESGYKEIALSGTEYQRFINQLKRVSNDELYNSYGELTLKELEEKVKE